MGAKKTRAGCDNTSEKFESIVEACAQWHAKQSFLGVREEQFLSSPLCVRKRKQLFVISPC